jgi:O-antigen ligase/tetratricopeptide (TPR) repeat protein
MISGLPQPRTLGEWLAIGAGLAVFGYVGWDSALRDARVQLLLHLIGVGAILGLGVVVLRGGSLPRTRIDLPLLGLLAAFALATVSALNVGMSLRAMAAIVGFAAMLPIAMLAVRHRPAWVGIVTSVPVLLLAAPSLAVQLSRRLDWILVGAPGLPPLRLPSEGTPFGSVAVPPFVIIPAWALAGLIEPAWLRRAVRIGLAAVGIPMTILSGSRSAWLAIAATAVIAVLPLAWRSRHRLRRPARITWREVAAGIGALAVLWLVAALVIPRLTAVTSLLYRIALWRDTLAAWQSDPLLGIGPGFMPYARQAAAADFTFPVRQPHSHNLPLGVLGDAGLVGLVAAAALVVALVVVAGPWRSRTAVGRAASLVLIGLGIGGLFEDLTFVPGFDLLAIALVAVALLDAGAVEWVRPAPRPLARLAPVALAGGLAGVVLLAAMVTADSAGIAYRAGIDSAARDDWAESTRWLSRATEIDPWHPAGPAALAVAAEASGEPDLARSAAEDATALNPGDASAWANLSLLCRRAEDRACQIRAAERAAATARYGRAELLNAANSLEAAGETEAADRAYRLSLLSQAHTSFVLDWPRTVPIGEGTISDYTDASWQLHRLLALHAMGEPIDPAEFDDDAVRALAHASLGEREAAEAHLAAAIGSAPEATATWDVAIILLDAWGEPVTDEMRIASVVHGRPFPERDAEVEVAARSFDVGSFRASPRDGLVADAIRPITQPPYPWPLAELLP